MWWTTQENERLARLVDEGVRPQEIAAQMKRTLSAVEHHISDLRRSETITTPARMASPLRQETVDRVRDLAAAGDLTAAQIGDRVGMTRNAVIGLCRRRGIKLRSPGSRTPSVTVVPHRQPATPARVAPTVTVNLDECRALLPVCEPIPDEAGDPVSFMALRAGQCRWIAGHPSGLETLYCGCRVKPGSSYCPTHWRRSIADAQPKRLRRLPSPRAHDRFRSLLRVPEAPE